MTRKVDRLSCILPARYPTRLIGAQVIVRHETSICRLLVAEPGTGEI